ncbi:heterokaryon incompatibility protein-domain-containing protein [Xylaria sp. FL0064]|nr:heterokaryon incompatibility protein-domain-containing protein [Xylaria sp. FL0064]
MRLIQCHTLELQEFSGPRIPPYAILSHTWQDGEVTFAEFLQGVKEGDNVAANGWRKITQTCKLAIAEGYEYAINSMYSWYAGSGECIAYLSDFNQSTSGPSNYNKQFFSSRWFTRGWTLQELIAPENLRFYDSSWTPYGSKASLSSDIAYATRIDEKVLCAAGPALRGLLASIPTQRPEDIAYSLLGIFGVHMPLIYGEGDNAFIRLQKKIINQALPWDHFSDIVLSQDLRYNPDSSITNKGLQIAVALPTVDGLEKPIMSLHCHRQDRPRETLGIYLSVIGGNVYSRALPDKIPIEIEGERLPEASIFLITQPHRSIIPNLALVRGHHFSFKHTYHPDMRKSIRLMSTYPEKRWDERFGFRAKDTPSFIGINMYQASWQDEKTDFVVVCGFNPDYEPWVCLCEDGSDLWYAAMHRDSMRVGELAPKLQRDEVMLNIKIFLSVEVRPFRDEDDEPKWMQVVLHVDRKRKRHVPVHGGRSQRQLALMDRRIQYLPEPDPA